MRRPTEQERFENAVTVAQQGPCGWPWRDCTEKRGYADWLCPAHRKEWKRIYDAADALTGEQLR